MLEVCEGLHVNFLLGDFIFVNRTGSSSSHHLTTMLLSSNNQSTFLHSLTEEIPLWKKENLFILAIENNLFDLIILLL